MTSSTKHPAILVSALGAVLLIVSGFISWVSISGDTAAFVKPALDLVSNKMSIAMWLGILSLIVVLVAGMKAMKGLLVLSILFALVGFIFLYTAYIPADDAASKLLGINGMSSGYYVGWVGAVLLLVGNIAAMAMMKKMPKK